MDTLFGLGMMAGRLRFDSYVTHNYIVFKYPAQTWIPSTVWQLNCPISSRPFCWWGFVRIWWILPPLHGEWRVLGPLLLHRICPLQNQTEKQKCGLFKWWCQFRWREQNQVHHPSQNTFCHLLVHRSRPVWHKLYMVFTDLAGWFIEKTYNMHLDVTFSQCSHNILPISSLFWHLSSISGLWQQAACW